MSMVKKSITGTDSQDDFIQAQIAPGYYASDSEVIREALREKELRKTELDALRAKLIASEESGASDRPSRRHPHRHHGAPENARNEQVDPLHYECR